MSKSIYSSDSEKLAQLLRDYSASRGLSIRDLATKLKTSKTSVHRLLSGQKQLEFLEWLRFCEALDIEPGDFLQEFTPG